MADLKKAQNLAMKAKSLYIGRGLKGFFMTTNDYTELLSALSDEEEEQENDNL